MKGKLSVLILLICCAALPARAQVESSGGTLLQIEPHFGFVIPHRPQMHALIKGHVIGFAIAAEWQGKAEKEWKKAYRYPSTGFELQLMNLGNPDQLGNSIGGFFCMSLPLDQGGKLNHSLRLGIGLAALSKIYGLRDNPKNLAIGSRFNGAMLLNYRLNYGFHPNWRAFTSIKLTHYSNGAFQVPNLGMNMLTAGIGLAYLPQPLKTGEKFKAATPPGSFYVLQAFGLKENFPPMGTKYLALTMGGGYDHRLSIKASVGIRMDVFYSNAVKASMEKEDREANFGQVLQSGIALGYMQHFGRMGLRFQTGTYLRDEYKGNGNLYSRLVVEHHIGKHFFASLALKTHFAKADHFELGMGWRR